MYIFMPCLPSIFYFAYYRKNSTKFPASFKHPYPISISLLFESVDWVFESYVVLFGAI